MKAIISQIYNWILTLFSSESNNADIPSKIDDQEILVRILFSPNYVTADGTRLRPSAFRSPALIDEVSVNRLQFCSPSFCKVQGKQMHAPTHKRSYFGLGVIRTSEVRQTKANAIYTPKQDNTAHADIQVGFICQKGEQLPAEYQLKINEMSRVARLYKDPNIEVDHWTGPELL